MTVKCFRGHICEINSTIGLVNTRGEIREALGIYFDIKVTVSLIEEKI